TAAASMPSIDGPESNPMARTVRDIPPLLTSPGMVIYSGSASATSRQYMPRKGRAANDYHGRGRDPAVLSAHGADGRCHPLYPQPGGAARAGAHGRGHHRAG